MKFKRTILFVFLLIFALSLFSFLIALKNERFAVLFSNVISDKLKYVLSSITSLISLSFFEISVIASPLLIFIIIKHFFKDSKGVSRRFLYTLGVLSIIPSLYIITLAIPSLAGNEHLNFEMKDNINLEDSVVVANKLIDKLEALGAPQTDGDDYVASLKVSYSKLTQNVGNVHHFPRPKHLITSRIVSYFGIYAFYSFPTAEVNLNSNIPKYSHPFNVAHEYAHYIGVDSEGKANFLAYLACINSENNYAVYSGCVSALEYLLKDIYLKSSEKYTIIYNSLPIFIKSDIESMISFNAKYSKGFIYKLFDGMNSLYLNKTDPGGSNSYSDFTEYLLAYYFA